MSSTGQRSRLNPKSRSSRPVISPCRLNEGNVVPVAQLLRVRRLVADQPQARNAAALLVDRDDRLDFAEIAQVIDQLPELRRALNVAPEENEPARLDPTK